ncbi:hypothetical protein ES703_91802 [subsurface metagenome]
MSNGSETGECATEQGGKMTVISKKINYLIESSKKNLNLSSEIRAKLLCTEAAVEEADKKPVRGDGQLNNIIDNLQEILNIINASNSHLIIVNKEI